MSASLEKGINALKEQVDSTVASLVKSESAQYLLEIAVMIGITVDG